jgi:hypothetical protein
VRVVSRPHLLFALAPRAVRHAATSAASPLDVNVNVDDDVAAGSTAAAGVALAARIVHGLHMRPLYELLHIPLPPMPAPAPVPAPAPGPGVAAAARAEEPSAGVSRPEQEDVLMNCTVYADVGAEVGGVSPAKAAAEQAAELEKKRLAQAMGAAVAEQGGLQQKPQSLAERYPKQAAAALAQSDVELSSGGGGAKKPKKHKRQQPQQPPQQARAQGEARNDGCAGGAASTSAPAAAFKPFDYAAAPQVAAAARTGGPSTPSAARVTAAKKRNPFLLQRGRGR